MKNIKIIWILSSIVGSIIYSVISLLSFDAKSGFVYPFSLRFLFFMIFVVLSLLFFSPVLFLDKIIKLFRKFREKKVVNITLFFLSLVSLYLFYLFGMRGLEDYLCIGLSYISPLFFLVNMYGFKNNDNYSN